MHNSKRWLAAASLAALSVLFWSGGCGLLGGGGNPDPDGGGDDASTPRHLQYIRADDYGSLVGEVDYVEGSGPADGVLDSTGSNLEGFLEKPGGIDFRTDGTISSKGSDHEWTLSELRQVAQSTFDESVSDETIRVHVLYVDGHYEKDSGNSKVLGLAWGNKNIAIFEDNVDDACESASLAPGPFRRRMCRKVEESVLIHEIGHTVGLVNNGLEPQADHHDEAHGAHCDRDDCVMYWRNRTSDVVSRIEDRFGNDNEQALGFGPDCREDVDRAKSTGN